MSEILKTPLHRPDRDAAARASELKAVDAPDRHDRVADAYFGRMGESFQRQTHARVHWICRQVRGTRVLDIGCSQGIAALLLAREGKQVLGLDVDAKAIDEARAQLEGESFAVRRSVEFLNADATTHDFGRSRFDSVIIGEVLEHLVHPQRILDLAAARLVKGGRVIVTVPFGVNDFIDHKSTYYLQEPVDLVAERFHVEDVVVLDRWLGVVGVAREPKRSRPTRRRTYSANLVASLERGFHRLERSLMADIASARRLHEQAEARSRASLEQNASLKLQVQKLDASNRVLQESIATRDADLEVLRNAKAKVDAEHSATRMRLDETNLKYRSSTEQVAALRAEQERLQKALTDALGEIQQSSLANAHWQSEAQRLTNVVAQRDANATQLDAAIASTRLELESVREELRVSIEGCVRLSARVAELEEANAKAQRSADEAMARVGAAMRRDARWREIAKGRKVQREALRRNLAEITSRSEALALERDEQARTVVQLKAELLRQRVSVEEANAKAERNHILAVEAKRKQAKVRATLSFQLGHALIHGGKSWRNLRSLPKTLLELRREAVRRRSGSVAMPVIDAQPQPPARVPAVAPEPTGQPDLAGRLRALRVAAVFDEFTSASFAPECNLLELVPGSWRGEVERFRPELLLIESAWRGKDSLWGNKVGHRSAELVDLVQWCRDRAVPAAFWNKEDPVHFDTFLNTAKLFDLVFTTDIDCIPRYKAALGHDNVFLLPFACQPALHNPVEVHEREDAICFAGAYYARYPERTRDLLEFVSKLPAFKPVAIYDRNYGKDDVNYKFPAEYEPFIVGNLPFDQIDRAYKGYRYAINLNSVKQSQSMFARRVFELLASNTLTLSNYSRAVRLLFGDLVITSDSGQFVMERLAELAGDERAAAKLRLAALRKVMSEHTYQDRLAYIAKTALGVPGESLLPELTVVAAPRTEWEVAVVRDAFARQTHSAAKLTLILPDELIAPAIGDDRVRIVPVRVAKSMTMRSLGEPNHWVAGMVAPDYYGPNYLMDLILATRYASLGVVGKCTHFVRNENGGVTVVDEGCQYRRVNGIAARRGAARLDVVEGNLAIWAEQLDRATFDGPALAVDEFNYCADANGQRVAEVDDLEGLDSGASLARFHSSVEEHASIPVDGAAVQPASLPDLATLFRSNDADVSVTASERGLELHSTLQDGSHQYLYATREHDLSELGVDGGTLELHAIATPGLNLQITLLFLNDAQVRIGHQNLATNRNHTVELPKGTQRVRFGLRFYASGAAVLESILLGHLDLQPNAVVTRGEHLIVTNQYPAYDDLYRNAFVHARVRAYRRSGVAVDVFRIRTGEPLSYHEFEGVDCISGSDEALRRVLDLGSHRTILVHFMDESLWETLRHYVEKTRIVVWVHGAEIQPYHRREFNYTTAAERVEAQHRSKERINFWRVLLRYMPPNLHLVFVSQYFAEQVMSDLGFRLPASQYSIIHNPIDTEVFAYAAKTAEQRKRILSIRPYTSPTYANDLMVKAIIELSSREFFSELNFTVMGDGPLFDETLAPLRGFANVTIERGFLTHSQIATVHRSHGILLCPTRMDTHGVSRDEAMASGLVPVTSAVAAVPEFVDESCGILAPAEDHIALADGIAALYESPARFLAMSAAARARVVATTAAGLVIDRELALIENPLGQV